MKAIIGFFMAWGNFITLPCPYKRWDSSLKNMMLMFLPAIGAIIGILWLLVTVLLQYFRVPDLINAVVSVFFIFAICGFMHLDGFMDCNDAILSRRPLEERQRIMKDSNVGSFAVVTLVFLLIGWFAVMYVVLSGSIDYEIIFFIPIVSRGFAGLYVMSFDPIGHSQYVEDSKEPDRWKYRLGIIVQLCAFIGIIAYFMFRWNPETLIILAIVLGVEFVVGLIAVLFARHQLGGMSGDIAGYCICFSEFAGVLTLALI